MKHILLLTSILLFTSCIKKVTGTLDVKEELQLKGKKGTTTIASGIHAAQLKLKSKKRFTLVVTQNGSKSKFKFNVPAGTAIPQHSGNLRLNASETGQPYDLSATVTREVSTSEPRSSVESCSRTIYRQHCHNEVRRHCHTDHHGNRVCRNQTHRVCRRVGRTVYGSRNVTYRLNGKTTTYAFDLLKPENQAIAAQFKGYDYSSRRETLNWGPCILRGHHGGGHNGHHDNNHL